MLMPGRRRRASDRLSDLGLVLAAMAAVCCVGLPAVAALLGGVTIAARLGVGGGLLVVAALLAMAPALVRARRGGRPGGARR